MRKLFWSCAAVAVAAAGTVYLAAKHVDQHPYAVMGQTVRSLCGTEHESSATSPAAENAVPAEPTPTELSSTGAVEPPRREVVAVADPSLPGHITVGEGDSGSPMQCADSSAPSTGDATTLSGYSSSPACPLVMPYCCDDSRAPQHMPYADEESCEQSDEQSCVDVSKGLFQILMDLFGGQVSAEPMTAGSEPMGCTLPEGFPSGKCQEDEHYHQQYPSCPYTGRSYPQDETPSPAVPDAPEEKKVEKCGPKKDKTEEMPPTQKSSTSEEPKNDQASEFHLDTMEFRPSDAGLHRFIPGAL
ncbi:MAG: hypothetical protein HYS12_06120 [Planctomycetes bacterium]|nr:hypothetical protein [Planctomycetota bacterium]